MPTYKKNEIRFTSGKSYWTQKYLAWLRSLEMDVLMREILDEYLQTHQNMADKIERFDKRIEELAGGTAYAEKVKTLSSLIGIRTHTALALVVETGDFARFAKANPRITEWHCREQCYLRSFQNAFWQR